MATNYRSWEHVHRPLSYILRSAKFTGTLLTSKQQSPKKLTYLAVGAESGRGQAVARLRAIVYTRESPLVS